jgi:hypothetical protein
MSHRRVFLTALVVAALPLLIQAANPTFVPDATVKGSSLNGWRPLGAAEWKAKDGEVTGIAKAGGPGGWLFLEHSYQDVGLFASFQCTGACKTGVLLRAEKTPDGMKGVYVSLSDPEFGVVAYHVKIDANGRETHRERLRGAGGQNRLATPSPERPAAAPSGPPRTGLAAMTNLGDLPIQRPSPGLRGGWNDVEILLDANILRAFLNDGGSTAGGAADDELGRFGPLALHVAEGQVQFRNIAYKDLGLKETPMEQVSSRFRMQRINDFFYGWSAAAADFNGDGVPDIVAGPYYYLGPDYTKSREIYLAQGLNSSTQYPTDCWVTHAYDFTGDGWADVLTTSHSANVGAILYVNPKGEARRWDKHQVVPAVATESTLLRDIDGDGKPDLVYGAEGFLRYAHPDPSNPTGTWRVRTITEKGPWGFGHGIGVGDVNGDGRMDVVSPWGWWEQPAKGSNQELWTYHPAAFGRWSRGSPGGAEIAVYDVNGDGLNDIVTGLQAHGFGLAWFEQKKENGKISFVRHMVMDDYSTENAGGVTFSQLHGSAVTDVDGDGITDYVVGKRYWSHLDNYYDPDPYGPAVLYWYKTVRDPKAPGGARLVPELIHNRSGAGSDVLATDLNRDGVIDIVTSTRQGTFIFWGKKP